MTGKDLRWKKRAEKLASAFAKRHRVVLSSNERQLSAAFEIGSLHALLRFYRSQHYSIVPQNLSTNDEYLYLTTPAGNPANFSYVDISGVDGQFEVRQQVRVQSHVDPHITFTPDIVVLQKGAQIDSSKHVEYAGGKRPFYRVASSSVVAAHECKSMNPFPELLVSFIGMLVAAHAWYPASSNVLRSNTEGHLAPTLFVGGSSRALHLRMVSAMQTAYSINILCGLHEGTWSLVEAKNRLIWTPGGVKPAGLIKEEDIPF